MFARTAVTGPLPIKVVYSRGMSEPGYLKHRTEKNRPHRDSSSGHPVQRQRRALYLLDNHYC